VQDSISEQVIRFIALCPWISKQQASKAVDGSAGQTHLDVDRH
jgi:hypothetical protein